MTNAALARAIARRINQEQYTGGRLAGIGNAGHPQTVAEIVIEEMVRRGALDADRPQPALDLPLEKAA